MSIRKQQEKIFLELHLLISHFSLINTSQLVMTWRRKIILRHSMLDIKHNPGKALWSSHRRGGEYCFLFSEQFLLGYLQSTTTGVWSMIRKMLANTWSERMSDYKIMLGVAWHDLVRWVHIFWVSSRGDTKPSNNSPPSYCFYDN